MNNNGDSFIIGCAPFGLDDQVACNDGATIARKGFLPASVLLPDRLYGPILTGNRARAERIHSGLPWPPEASINKGAFLRRAPVSLVWRALVEARDSQVNWDIGNGVSFPLARILANHIADLLPLSKAGKRLNLTVPIPNDLDEYGQEVLLSEMRRLLHERELDAEIQLLWRPIAAALAWLDAVSKDIEISTVRANPNDFILMLYLGPDAIECVTLKLRIRHSQKRDFIVPLRDRPMEVSPLAGYDWIGGMIEQLLEIREEGDGALWQAFTSFPESWSILAEKELQRGELPRIWGGDKKYSLWNPDEQKLKEIFFRIPCRPCEKIQLILKASCALHGSSSSNVSWPQRLTAIVTNTINRQNEGHLLGVIVFGALAPPSPPSWLSECFPVFQSRGMNPIFPWHERALSRLWMSPGDGVIAQGAVIFNDRLINCEPTYLDTLPQYYLLARKEGRYTTSPLVHAQEVDGGEYYENKIADRYMIEKDQQHLDIMITKGSGSEKLLESNTGINALDNEVCREVEGLSMASASLIRHLVRTAVSHNNALEKVRTNIRIKGEVIVRRNTRNIRETIQENNHLYANLYADLWHGKPDHAKKTSVNIALAESKFRKVTFSFPGLSPKEMPVNIHVGIRPASGMAKMEVIPIDAEFLHGRKVIADYRTMRPCSEEDLREDVRGWPPLEELAPHPDASLWNQAKILIKSFEQNSNLKSGFVNLVSGMYDLVKSPKLYIFPIGNDRIYLPLLNQNGIAGSQEGVDTINRFCSILQSHTKDINTWAAGQREGQVGWLITRASWLYGSTPSTVITRIHREIARSRVAAGTIIEAGSRSLTETSHLTDLLNCISIQIRAQRKLVIQHIRATRNILTLRHNGQDALNENTAKIILEAILKEIDRFSIMDNYKSKFFESIKLLLYLLRYRKRNPHFLEVNSKEAEIIKDNLVEYLSNMKKRMTPAKFVKAKEIISGTIDYLNYVGKVDFLNILTEYSEADDDD